MLYYILNLRYILLNYILYNIYIILYYIIYIWAFLSSLAPLLCYNYSFAKRTIELPIMTREEKRTDTALFSGRITFFLREQKFWTRTTFWIFRASPITLLRSLSCHSFRNLLLTLLAFIKRQPCDAKYDTMMALLFWLAIFYIFGFFTATKSPTTYSSLPKPPINSNPPVPSSVPTTFFPGARSHGFFRSW